MKRTSLYLPVFLAVFLLSLAYAGSEQRNAAFAAGGVETTQQGRGATAVPGAPAVQKKMTLWPFIDCLSGGFAMSKYNELYVGTPTEEAATSEEEESEKQSPSYSNLRRPSSPRNRPSVPQSETRNFYACPVHLPQLSSISKVTVSVIVRQPQKVSAAIYKGPQSATLLDNFEFTVPSEQTVTVRDPFKLVTEEPVFITLSDIKNGGYKFLTVEYSTTAN